jgi:hypothetical protein
LSAAELSLAACFQGDWEEAELRAESMASVGLSLIL